MSDINIKTNSLIDTANIIATTDDYVVEATSNGWRMIESQDMTTSEDETVISKSVPDKADVSLLSNTLANTQNQAVYTFAIQNFIPVFKTYADTYGILSKSIAIQNYRYIELDADIQENENSSVEFSIVDGTTDNPVLPISITKINNERLFYGLPTRFDIDTSHTTVVKKDGVEIGTYNEFDKTLLRGDSIYTISYVPINTNRMSIVNTSFKIKIVVRVYNGGYPPSVSNIILKKYGGTLEWQY